MALISAPGSRESARWNFRLGYPGFRFADLNRVRRLALLDQVFRDELRAADPTLSADYERYRAARGEGYAPLAASDIIIKVAVPLGPVTARLFHIQAPFQAPRARPL